MYKKFNNPDPISMQEETVEGEEKKDKTERPNRSLLPLRKQESGDDIFNSQPVTSIPSEGRRVNLEIKKRNELLWTLHLSLTFVKR